MKEKGKGGKKKRDEKVKGEKGKGGYCKPCITRTV